MESVYYVYIHYRLDSNTPFYVGKGKNRRAYDKRGRNSFWKRIVDKHGYRVEIKSQDLTEQEAFNLEINTIEELRKIYTLANVTEGGEGKTPLWFIEKQEREIEYWSKKLWDYEVKRFLPRLDELFVAAEGLQKTEIVEIIEELKKRLNGKENQETNNSRERQ